MKLTFRKLNLRDRIERVYENYKSRRRDRQLNKVEVLAHWHEVYAWYPMRLTTNDDSLQFAWFEKVHQRYNAKRTESELFMCFVIKKTIKDRHTAKDFFKLKLKGKIKDEGVLVGMGHDGTDMQLFFTDDAGNDTQIIFNNTRPKSSIKVKNLSNIKVI